MVNKLGSLCSMINCDNYTQQKNRRTFHRFPKDQAVCSEWVERCKRQDLSILFRRRGSAYLNHSHRVCSDHFAISDFRNPNLKSQGLNRGVVPSVMLPEGATTTVVKWTNPTCLQLPETDQTDHQLLDIDATCLQLLDTDATCLQLPNSEPTNQQISESKFLVELEVYQTPDSGVSDANQPDSKDGLTTVEKVTSVIIDKKADMMTKMRRNLNNAYKRCHKQKKVIRKLREENRAMKEELAYLNPISKLVEENRDSESFLINQLKQQKKKGKGRRYTPSEKDFALDLYRCSPKAYRLISSKFCLPTVRLLQSWQQSLKVIPIDFDLE